MYQISQSFPPLSPSPSFPPLFLTSRGTLLSEHLEQANREKSLKRERHTRKETGEREGGRERKGELATVFDRSNRKTFNLRKEM